MELKRNNNAIKIMELYNIQVVGCLGTLYMSLFNESHDVITDIAFINTDTQEVIYKRSLYENTCINYDEYIADKLEAICYFLSHEKYDRIDLENIMQKLINNNMTLMIMRVKQAIKKEIEHENRINTLTQENNTLQKIENSLQNNQIILYDYEIFYNNGNSGLLILEVNKNSKYYDFIINAIKQDKTDTIKLILSHNDTKNDIKVINTYDCQLCRYNNIWYYHGLSKSYNEKNNIYISICKNKDNTIGYCEKIKDYELLTDNKVSYCDMNNSYHIVDVDRLLLSPQLTGKVFHNNLQYVIA